jgi:hypothetical protein
LTKHNSTKNNARAVYIKSGDASGTIAGAIDIPGQAIIDGVVVHEGRPNFAELQAELAAPSTFSGETVTCANSPRLTASKRC